VIFSIKDFSILRLVFEEKYDGGTSPTQGRDLGEVHCGFALPINQNKTRR